MIKCKQCGKEFAGEITSACECGSESFEIMIPIEVRGCFDYCKELSLETVLEHQDDLEDYLRNWFESSTVDEEDILNNSCVMIGQDFYLP